MKNISIRSEQKQDWRRDCKFYGSELLERTFTFRNTKECLLNVDDEEKYN